MDGDGTTRQSRWRGFRKLVVPAAGIVLVGVGVGIQIWTAFHTTSFGWFAYAPLSGTRPTPFTGTEPGPWGAVLTTAGLVILAFWAGLLIGTRRSPAR